MGGCVGRCLDPPSPQRSYHSPRSLYFHGRDDVEFDFLVDETETIPNRSNRFKRIRRIFNWRSRKQRRSEVTLEFTDDSWRRPEPIQRPTTSILESNHLSRWESEFEPLDARILMAARARIRRSGQARGLASPTPSSLDLEWEHESGQQLQIRAGGDTSSIATGGGTSVSLSCGPNGTECRGGADSGCPSGGEWSRLSTPDSLEWDHVQPEELEESFDTETELLLTEIERLTARALRETGEALVS